MTKTLIAATLIAASITAPATAHAYPNNCHWAARLYRNDLNHEPPPYCWGSSWFRATDGHWDRPLPPDQDQGTRRPPPSPPADVPPPPPGDNDDAP
jgi:hypothetical protein